MSRLLTSIPNTDSPTPDYPNGKIRNKDLTTGPPTVGSPVVEELYGDIIQFFQKLLIDAGITANGNPDNISNGYQLIVALIAKIEAIAYNKAVSDANYPSKDDLNEFLSIFGQNYIIKGCVFTRDSEGYIIGNSDGKLFLNGQEYDVEASIFTGEDLLVYYFNISGTTVTIATTHPAGSVQINASSGDHANLVIKYLSDIIALQSDYPSTAWTNLSLLNGWTCDRGFVQWRKDLTGLVHVRWTGVLSGASASSIIIAALPIAPLAAFSKVIFDNLATIRQLNVGFNLTLPTTYVYNGCEEFIYSID